MLIAIVGMPGSGKGEAAKAFIEKGFQLVHFGSTVVGETKRRNLAVSERNERMVRESLRAKHGMSAIAKLSIPTIEKEVRQGRNVVIDGLYSWEELIVLRKRFPGLKLLAVFASPETRCERLSKRKERPLRKEEVLERDRAEIEKLNKAGPIAIADFTIVNEGTKEELRKQAEAVLEEIKRE